jgi:hypothetical protein
MRMTSPAELKRLYREGRVMPFVGAGASMSLSWDTPQGKARGPSWGEVVDEACRQLGYEEPDLLRYRGTNLQILEYFEHKFGNFAPLTNWLVRRLDVSDDAIEKSSLHTALANLKEADRFYTTNYDDFIERALKLSGRVVQTITGERDMGGGRGEVEVVKFHGDFNSPDRMVLSEGQYYDRMRLDSPLDLKLRSDLLGRVCLFIGYSFGDMNVAYLFNVINSMFRSLPNSPTGRRAYIISHNPSEFEYVLFRKRNIEVVPTFGDDRAAGVVEILSDMMS